MTGGPSSRAGLFRMEMGTAGTRVVFLHGLFGHGRNWTTAAKRLSADHRVTLVDLPNHGRSPWTDEVSYLDMADRVAALLSLDDPAHVVGHSMGGKVAMVLALRHAALVRRLVVSDVAPVRYQRLTGFATYVQGMLALDLDALPDRGTADRRLEPFVADPVVRSFLLQNLRRDGQAWRWQPNLRLLGDQLDRIGDWPDLHPEPYGGPVLWLAGERSDYIRPEFAPAMRALFPRVRLVTVKDAGHWVHSEQPAVFGAALEEFLHP